MPEIPALPEELLELIFSYFHPSEDLLYGFIAPHPNPQEFCKIRRVLASLCLVNKQCCRLAQPFLYHTIHLMGEDGPPDRSSNMLQKLVRTLVYQPIFTSYVVKLCVDAAYLDDTRGERDSWDLSCEDAVDSFCAFEQDDASRQNLLDHLRDGTLGAYTALLLAMCQDAQSMVTTFPEYNDRFARRILYDAAGGVDPSVMTHSPALSSLKVLTFQSIAEDGTLLSDFIHLFRLPTLETFCGFAIDCTLESWSQYDSFASTLTRIDLKECIIDAGGMKSILQACPHLQDLAVIWGEALLGEYEKDFDDLGQQLNIYGKSLKKFTIDVRQSHHDTGTGLGDLSQMTSLKSLNALGEVLVGRNEPTDIILPTSLEYLTVKPGVMYETQSFWQQLHGVADRGNMHHLLAIQCSGYEENEIAVFWSRATGFQE